MSKMDYMLTTITILKDECLYCISLNASYKESLVSFFPALQDMVYDGYIA